MLTMLQFMTIKVLFYIRITNLYMKKNMTTVLLPRLYSMQKVNQSTKHL